MIKLGSADMFCYRVCPNICFSGMGLQLLCYFHTIRLTANSIGIQQQFEYPPRLNGNKDEQC